jgi:hypothetical protein
MGFQNRLAGAGNVNKRDFVIQKPFHRRFLGGIEDRAGASAPAGHIES